LIDFNQTIHLQVNFATNFKLRVMKKLLSGVFVLLISAHTVFGQTSDANAVKLLKAVGQKYSAYKTMQMDISLTIENQDSKSKETKTGKVSSKGNMFKADMGNQTIISDGKTLWTYLKDVNEVQINNFEQGQDIMTPNDIFKIAEKDYLAYMGEKITENGKTIQVIELTPKNKNLSFSKIKMYIDISDNTVKRGVVYDKNAMHYTYTISNLKTNMELSDSTFKFDKAKYPGVEVIDLRE
jgi:outer membrane lipoprotein carrier protein